MLLDRLGNRVERGSLLVSFGDTVALVVVTRVAKCGGCWDIFGIILEWDSDASAVGRGGWWDIVYGGTIGDHEVICEGLVR